MALAGLFVDCTWESQPSSCAFSWGPMKRQGNTEAIKESKIPQELTNKVQKSNRFKNPGWGDDTIQRPYIPT